jgi:hypothetical protein
MRYLAPGFYFAIGNGSELDTHDTIDPIVRIYWHLTAPTSVEYIRLVSVKFNKECLPFRTKVLADPTAYYRADAGVLYIEWKHFSKACPIIREIYDAIKAELRPETPMFTKTLAPGLALAEDPSNGLSFGQSRCRAVARALWLSHVRGVHSVDHKVGLCLELFKDEGIDPENPFLTNNKRDIYTLNILGGLCEGGGHLIPSEL